MALHAVWDGEVVFDMRFQVAGTDRIAQQILDAWAAQQLFPPTKTAAMVTLVWNITTTRDVKFAPPEQLGDEARAFSEFWVWFKQQVVLDTMSDGTMIMIADDPSTMRELYERIDFSVGRAIRDAWFDAWEAAQGRYKAPISIAHPATLTAEEQADPESQTRGKTPAAP